MPELIVILVIALIVFGPKKLPEVGRSLGKAMREFKRTTEDIKGKFEEQINAEEFKDIKSGLNDIKAEIKSVTEMPFPAQTPAQPETETTGATRVAETGAAGIGETPVEVKVLAKEASGPLTDSSAPAPAQSPAPSETPAPAQSGADVPARTETGAAGTARAATGAGKKPDSSDPASQHGEG